MNFRPQRLVASLQFHAGRLAYPRYKRPVVILFRYTKALGDNLMLTTVAREVRKRNPQALIHVITGLPEIFDRNPDVNFVSAEPLHNVPNIGRYLIRYEHRFPWKKHLLHYCAECVDIHDEITLKPYIFPGEADRAAAEKIIDACGAPPILINRVAGPRTDKKNWPRQHWATLVSLLLEKGPVIDVGTRATAPLNIEHPRFHDLLGATTIHQTAALMEKSRLLISPITGTMHLAAACDLPTLSIVGGSEPAAATQYPGNQSLASRPGCANCYEQGPCVADFRCLWDIKPETAYLSALKMLEQAKR